MKSWTLNASVVSRKGQTRALVVIRFNSSCQNYVGDDRILIINKSRLVDQRGEIKVTDTCSNMTC